MTRNAYLWRKRNQQCKVVERIQITQQKWHIYRIVANIFQQSAIASLLFLHKNVQQQFISNVGTLLPTTMNRLSSEKYINK